MTDIQEGMAVTPTITGLVDHGWFIKLVTDHESRPTPCWRVWVSWRRGPQPHKEESTRVDSLEEAAAWLSATVDAWEYD